MNDINFLRVNLEACRSSALFFYKTRNESPRKMEKYVEAWNNYSEANLAIFEYEAARMKSHDNS